MKIGSSTSSRTCKACINGCSTSRATVVRTSSAYNWTFDPPDGSSEWHCAEWWVDVATESYRFFSDSEEVTSLAFTGNAKSMMSAYTAVVVGATWYQQDGTILSPFVIWFDDLAIDDTRVGCQ